MGPTPYCHFIILICLSRAFVMDDDLLEIEMKIVSFYSQDFVFCSCIDVSL